MLRARASVCLPTAGLLAALVTSLGSQESSAHLDVPVSPVVVNVGGTRHLVHELHVTNFRREAVTLQRVSVSAGEGTTLLSASGDALARMVGRVGLPRDARAASTIAPGQRSVVYVWLPLPPPGRAPDVLAHRVDLSSDTLGAITVELPATRVSAAPVAEIDPPLSGGPWVAVFDPLLVGGHRTTFVAVEGRARIPGRFAVDWVRAPAEPGVRTPVDATRGFVAEGFGSDVLAVGNGVVVDARDGRPDLPAGVRAPSAPVPLADGSGNHVVLDIGNGRFAVYEHLQNDSVAVKTGERVRRGQVIARLGSSGSTSIGPHLHFHVADAGRTLAAEGQPFVLRAYEQLGAYPSIDALVAGDGWEAEARGSAARRGEHPASMSVLRF